MNTHMYHLATLLRAYAVATNFYVASKGKGKYIDLSTKRDIIAGNNNAGVRIEVWRTEIVVTIDG